MKKSIQFSLFTLLMALGSNMLGAHTDFDPVTKPKSIGQDNRTENQRQFFHENQIRNLKDLRVQDGYQEANERGLTRWDRFTRTVDHFRHNVAKRIGIRLDNNPKTVIEKALETNTIAFRNNFNFKSLPSSTTNIEELKLNYEGSNPFEKMNSDQINTFIENYSKKYLELNIIKNQNQESTILANSDESESFKNLSNQDKLKFLNEYAKNLETITNTARIKETNLYNRTKITLEALDKALKLKISNLEKSLKIQDNINSADWTTRWYHTLHKKLHDWSNNVLYNKAEGLTETGTIAAEIETLKDQKNKVGEILKNTEKHHDTILTNVNNYYEKTLQQVMTKVQRLIRNDLTIRYNKTTNKFEFHNSNVNPEYNNPQIIQIGQQNILSDRQSPLDQPKTNPNDSMGSQTSYAFSQPNPLSFRSARANKTLDDLVQITQEIFDDNNLENYEQKINTIKQAIENNPEYITAKNNNTLNSFYSEYENKILDNQIQAYVLKAKKQLQQGIS